MRALQEQAQKRVAKMSKPIKSTDFGVHGQVDLTDVRSLPDGKMKSILQSKIT